MAPHGHHPDDEIIGYEGRIGFGGSVSLWPVRVRDQYRQGRGCCLGTIALVVLGIVAAWALDHLVARRGRGAPGRPAQRGAEATWVASYGDPTVTARSAVPACPGRVGAPCPSLPPAGGGPAHGSVVA